MPNNLEEIQAQDGRHAIVGCQSIVIFGLSEGCDDRGRQGVTTFGPPETYDGWGR
jgi:hypothetical protein